MHLALLVSIPLALLSSSEKLSCAHGADMSLDMLEKSQLVSMRIPSLFKQNILKAASRTQTEGSGKMYAGKTTWITSWKLYPWRLASKKWGAIEAILQMTPSKACDIITDLALLVSIPLALLTSSEVLSCAHGTDMSLDMSEKCQLVSVRIPSLFQHNFLKAVRRTQAEGSCKVYEGTTTLKQMVSCTLGALQARSEEQFKHPCRWLLSQQHSFVPKHVTLSF